MGMREYAVSALITKIKNRGNYQRSLKLTDPVLFDYLDTAISEYWGRLVTKYEAYFTVRDESSTRLIADVETYGFPCDFFKLMGIDVEFGDEWVPLERFQSSDRTDYQQSGFGYGHPFLGRAPFRYRIEGEKFVIQPIPKSGRRLRIVYVKAAPKIVNTGQKISFWNGWEKLVILYAISDIKFAFGESLTDVEGKIAKQEFRLDVEADGYDAGDVAVIQDVYSSRGRGRGR